ncbi:MAG: SHOCT domain-containing protein [Sporichthyaceae bacterium]
MLAVVNTGGLMKDIRIDTNGDQRCWNCGSKSFTQKRTARSKVMGVTAGIATVGVAALSPLATKKKLKCQACDEYNDVGTAKPWTGPSNEKLAKKFGTDDVPKADGPSAPPAPVRPATPAVAPSPSRADELVKLAKLRDSGVLSEAEFAAEKARLLGG